MLTWSTSVHTTLSTDTQPTIIVTFDDAKYIFNASENAGRAFRESNGNWKKTKALFFTQSDVEKTSGLAGLLMTFADATINKLALYGPPGLTHIVASSRFYTFRDSVDIQTNEIPWTTPTGPIPPPCFSDTNLTVYAIPNLPPPSEPLSSTPNISSASPSSTEPLSVPVASTPSPELPPEKRKREPSPLSSRKRLNPVSLAPGTMILSEDRLRKKDFDPITLSGSIADGYRKMIINAMFPNTKPNPNLDPTTRKEQKRRSKEGMRAKALGKKLPPLEDDNPNIDVEVDSYRRPRGSLPNGFNKQLPRFTNGLPASSYPTMSYLIVGPRYRGKFDAEKARELGVVGPDRSRLTRGETITITVRVGEETIERVIRPEDVIGETEKPSAILLLDVPSPAHIGPLMSSFAESQFYKKILKGDNALASDSDDFELRAIYHLCGDKVLEDDAYKAFMNAFCPDVHHIVASRDHLPDPVTFTTTAYLQLRVNSLDQKMFPIPKYSATPKKDLKAIPGLPSNIQPMSTDLRFGLRPYSPPGIDPEIASLDKFHPSASGAEPVILSPAMQKKIRTAKASIQKQLGRDVSSLVDGGSQVSIIPLGTGGSLPNKYRNVSSTLIMIPEWGNILLDSGEGTWGQLARNFGSNAYGAWQVLRDLKCIFISHVHGDHHIGLAHLLAKRKSLFPPPDHPLYIVSIRPVHLYLRELSDLQDLGLFDPSGNGVISVISETLHDRATGTYHTSGMWQIGGNEPWLNFQTSVENANKMCDTLGLEYFRTVDVHHRCRAYGCSFKHKDGWSITFSGDTMPTDNLVRIGMNSTVLIHEATLGDDEADIAQQKSHSTIGQAIDIGQKMNAKNTLLTHFSARHPKLPPSITREMVEAGPDVKQLIVPAFDFLNMTIGDMWKMPYYIPVLYQNYRDIVSPELHEANSRSSSPAESSSSIVVARRIRVAMAS